MSASLHQHVENLVFNLFRTFIAFALLISCVVLSGCKKASTDPNSGPNHFAVNFTGTDWAAYSGWIILHNLNGDSTLAMREWSGPGLVDFGDVGSDHVTVTFVDSLANAWYLTSYMNAPAGTWLQTLEPSDTFGHADITVRVPAGNFSQIYVNWPGHGWSSGLGAMDTVVHVSNLIQQLDPGNTLSIFAKVTGQSGTFFGWLLQQPFRQHQVNSYLVDVNQPAHAATVTASRLLNQLKLFAYRTQTSSLFSMSSHSSPGGETVFTMESADFPASNWYLEGSMRGPFEEYTFSESFDQMPSTFEIPLGSISANYDYQALVYSGVSVAGPADMVRGSWSANLFALPFYHWDVVQGPGSSFIYRPTLPGEVRTRMRLQDVSFVPDRIAIKDFAALNGWDAYIQSEFGGPMVQSVFLGGYYDYSRSMSHNSPLCSEGDHPSAPATRPFRNP